MNDMIYAIKAHKKLEGKKHENLRLVDNILIDKMITCQSVCWHNMHTQSVTRTDAVELILIAFLQYFASEKAAVVQISYDSKFVQKTTEVFLFPVS